MSGDGDGNGNGMGMEWGCGRKEGTVARGGGLFLFLVLSYLQYSIRQFDLFR